MLFVLAFGDDDSSFYLHLIKSQAGFYGTDGRSFDWLPLKVRNDDFHGEPHRKAGRIRRFIRRFMGEEFIYKPEQLWLLTFLAHEKIKHFFRRVLRCKESKSIQHWGNQPNLEKNYILVKKKHPRIDNFILLPQL